MSLWLAIDTATDMDIAEATIADTEGVTMPGEDQDIEQDIGLEAGTAAICIATAQQV